LGTGQGDTDAEIQEGEEIYSQEDCSGEEEVRAAAEESGRLASARKWSRVRVLTKGQRRSAIRTVNCPSGASVWAWGGVSSASIWALHPFVGHHHTNTRKVRGPLNGGEKEPDNFLPVDPIARRGGVVSACQFDLAQRLSLQARLTMRLKSSEDFQ
jgi:hypothetical protein